MKTKLLILAAIAAVQLASAAEHFRWLAAEGDHNGAEIIYARDGNVFRGEYVDPGFQERCSVPIAGTIDADGNVQGVTLKLHGDAPYAKISGKISGDAFECQWLPSPDAPSELREMKLARKEFSPEAVEAQGKNPGAFYNSLHPELVLTNDGSMTLPRAIPFKIADLRTRKPYGYRIGEFESKYISVNVIRPLEDDKMGFTLHVEQTGQYDFEGHFGGAVAAKDNKFSYKKGDYEFEAAIYNGFIVVKTVSGVIKEEEDVKFTADGIYPAPLEMNFYNEKKSAQNMDAAMRKKVTAEIRTLPGLDEEEVEIIAKPVAAEPYYIAKAGGFYFHAYPPPMYEIAYYDSMSDAEVSLDEFRGNVGEIPARPRYAYVKLAPEQPEEGLNLLIDDVIVFTDKNRERYIRHGIKPGEGAILNTNEEWLPGSVVLDEKVIAKAKKLVTAESKLFKVTVIPEGEGYMVFGVEETKVP